MPPFLRPSNFSFAGLGEYPVTVQIGPRLHKLCRLKNCAYLPSQPHLQRTLSGILGAWERKLHVESNVPHGACYSFAAVLQMFHPPTAVECVSVFRTS